MNDADFQMARLEAAGRKESRLRKAGQCPHGWYHAPRGQIAKCNHCGKEFPDETALLAERSEILAEND